jgi:hypothetical protein
MDATMYPHSVQQEKIKTREKKQVNTKNKTKF